jgi:hypothetical protein
VRVPEGALVRLREASPQSVSRPEGAIRTRAQRVRLDDSGPELECRWCDEFWPLTLEFWAVKRDGHVNADRCRSCESERGKLRHALMRMDPDYMVGQRQRARRYRQTIRRLHPELVDAYERERKAMDRQFQRERREKRVAAA